MKKVLVTGGLGFVGITLCNRLIKENVKVCILDNFTYGESRLKLLNNQNEFDVRKIDILNKDAVKGVMESFEPDTLIHLAAIHFIPECNRRPVKANMTNVVGTQIVLDCASKIDSIKRTITISSAAVYPISDKALSHEFAPDPSDIYGITKATNEEQSKLYCKTTNVETISVRLFNVFGPGETNPHLIPEIIDQIKDGIGQLKLGNVEPKRSYIHVEDVASALISLSKCKVEQKYSCVNLGHFEDSSVKDVVDIINDLSSLELVITQDESKVRKADRMYLRCDFSYLNKLTGWEPKYGIREGLKELLALEGITCKS